MRIVCLAEISCLISLKGGTPIHSIAPLTCRSVACGKNWMTTHAHHKSSKRCATKAMFLPPQSQKNDEIYFSIHDDTGVSRHDRRRHCSSVAHIRIIDERTTK